MRPVVPGLRSVENGQRRSRRGQDRLVHRSEPPDGEGPFAVALLDRFLVEAGAKLATKAWATTTDRSPATTSVPSDQVHRVGHDAGGGPSLPHRGGSSASSGSPAGRSWKGGNRQQVEGTGRVNHDGPTAVAAAGVSDHDRSASRAGSERTVTPAPAQQAVAEPGPRRRVVVAGDGPTTTPVSRRRARASSRGPPPGGGMAGRTGRPAISTRRPVRFAASSTMASTAAACSSSRDDWNWTSQGASRRCAAARMGRTYRRGVTTRGWGPADTAATGSTVSPTGSVAVRAAGAHLDHVAPSSRCWPSSSPRRSRTPSPPSGWPCRPSACAAGSPTAVPPARHWV